MALAANANNEENKTVMCMRFKNGRDCHDQAAARLLGTHSNLTPY